MVLGSVFKNLSTLLTAATNLALVYILRCPISELDISKRGTLGDGRGRSVVNSQSANNSVQKTEIQTDCGVMPT